MLYGFRQEKKWLVGPHVHLPLPYDGCKCKIFTQKRAWLNFSWLAFEKLDSKMTTVDRPTSVFYNSPWTRVQFVVITFINHVRFTNDTACSKQSLSL
jgi:hypothetical protein